MFFLVSNIFVILSVIVLSVVTPKDQSNEVLHVDQFISILKNKCQYIVPLAWLNMGTPLGLLV
jgi:hypothetical protein